MFANLCKPIHDINYSLFALLNLESLERKEKKIHDMEYLENEESSLNEIIFHSS